jgi:hypothetical protein
MGPPCRTIRGKSWNAERPWYLNAECYEMKLNQNAEKWLTPIIHLLFMIIFIVNMIVCGICRPTIDALHHGARLKGRRNSVMAAVRPRSHKIFMRL